MFVIVTGVAGAAIGQLVRGWLPLRSSLARGALFGMGAHGAGTAKARELAAEEGAVAGLVMVMAGLFNVLVTPAVVAGLLALTSFSAAGPAPPDTARPPAAAPCRR